MPQTEAFLWPFRAGLHGFRSLLGIQMEPLDLTSRPPRSPYKKMEGLFMMPRTIDKLRAKLPGGKPGVYSISSKYGGGLSFFLLEGIGVTEERLSEVVQKVSLEEEISDWLRSNADLSKVALVNEKLASGQIKDVLAVLPWATFLKFYPAAEEVAKTTSMFEVLLQDDRRMFPKLLLTEEKD
jgi:hypothetical protein